jgi:hypothetical protein
VGAPVMGTTAACSPCRGEHHGGGGLTFDESERRRCRAPVSHGGALRRRGGSAISWQGEQRHRTMGMWRGPYARYKGEEEDGVAWTTEAIAVGSPEARKTAKIGTHHATIGGEVEREVAEGCGTRSACGSGS